MLMNLSFLKPMALLFVISILFSNCASIVSKTTNPVDIRTYPKVANVSITDKKGKEVFRGQSPTTVILKTGAGYFSKAEYQVRISSPGFTEKIVPINYKINGWYFGNFLFSGVIGMLIVDPATGAMWKLSDPLVEVTLDPVGSTALQTTSPELKIVDINHVSEETKLKLVRIN